MAPIRQRRAVTVSGCAATTRQHRGRHWRYLATAAFLCLWFAAHAAHAEPAAAQPAAMSSFDRAQQMRSQLAAKPSPRRTRSDYALVIDAYKVIYHGMPSSPHAVDSIVAVAELLEDEGHVFRDEKLFSATVFQYEYLRQHYPSSPQRAPALLAEAHVEQHDLHDNKAAAQKYSELITLYPRSPEADEAHTSLAALQPRAPADSPANPHGKPSAATAGPTASTGTTNSAAPAAPRTEGVHVGASQNAATDRSPSANLLSAGTSTHHYTAPARLTGIRQLITDDGVQLVFDLTAGVNFKAGRATGPTRLFFDLDNTHVERALTLHPMVVSADPAETWLVHRIRAAQFTPGMTRVVLEVDDSADAYASLVPNPWRLMIDVRSVNPPGATPPPQQQAAAEPTPPAAGPPPDAGSSAPPQPQYASQGQAAELPLDLPATLNDARTNQPENPAPAVRTPPPAQPASAATQPSGPRINDVTLAPRPASNPLDRATPAAPTTNGNSTLVRTLGLKIGRVVIDAGHGGHDTGTIGPGGLLEKDVVLDIAIRLGTLLQQRLGVQVVYTRSSDVFVPLEERTAIANSAQADLFISIHGNSSPEANVRGVETYFLSFTNQQDALEVATRENATSAADIHDLGDIVKRITMNDKMDESREFALDVQQSLYSGLVSGNSGLKDRGIKKAPFVVLIGANMPSILTEISFVTNQKDARELRDPKYRQRIAESLFRGVAVYMNSLSGVHAGQASARQK
jgi:N-acetylmuramoyl-L-alanine amidase